MPAVLMPVFVVVTACGEPPPPLDDNLEGAEVGALTRVKLAGEVKPDPNTVHVKAVNMIGGTGCPQGTVRSAIAADGQWVAVRFDQYVASMGPGIPLTRSRMQCTLNLAISVPQGFTFTVTQIDSRGFVNIPRGVTATRQSNYRFQGNAGTANPPPGRTTFTGPTDRDFVQSDVFDLSTLVFSACGSDSNLNVDTSLRLSGSRNKESFIALDSLEGTFVQRFHLAWRRCSG
jgi:hypothetical protein